MLERLEEGANAKVKADYLLRKANNVVAASKSDFFDPKQRRKNFFS